MTRLTLSALALAFVAACTSTPPDRIDTDVAPPPTQAAPQPIEVEDVYEAARLLTLPKVAPQAPPGIENVFELSENLISGGEPKSEAAFEELARRGVRTIVSVDGKAPDVETARRHGIRYVHLPIQYKGVTDEEVLELSKTFRELPGPFYVHCFHGKHRGPAAAAVGRLALDGVPREQALAEMRQYSGTSKKYAGLYDAIATRRIPTPEETAACPFDFPEQVRFGGVREAMIPLPRAFDNIKLLAKNDFGVVPDHPDIDSLNEATKVAQIFAEMSELDELETRGADFREWMAAAVTASHDLVELLKQPPTKEIREAAKATVKSIGKQCGACHGVYRN